MAHSGDFLAGSGLHLDRFRTAKMDAEEYTGQVGKYGKDFNIDMTRIPTRSRDLHDNMLAYSEHARRSNNQSRLISTSLPDVSLLRVRAHHIPDVKRARKPKRLAPLTPSDYADDDDVISGGDRLPKMNELFRRKIDKLRRERKSFEEEDRPMETEHKSSGFVLFDPGSEKSKKVHLPPKPVVGVADLDELIQKRRQRRPLSRSVWALASDVGGSMTTERTLSPTNAIVRESLRDSEEDGTAEDESPAARAERARKRREAKTRLLLRDAIASLQALEENINNPILRLPRLKKAKRLTLAKGTLDVIPEIRREDEAENVDVDNTDASVTMPTWRSEPGYKFTDYQHVYPQSNNGSVLDDGKYSIQSDPFQRRTTKGQQQHQQQQQQQQKQQQQHNSNSMRAKDPEGVTTLRRNSLIHDSMDHQRYDPDMHNKERKRRLQEHARIRFRKPTRIKFLKNDPDKG